MEWSDANRCVSGYANGSANNHSRPLQLPFPTNNLTFVFCISHTTILISQFTFYILALIYYVFAIWILYLVLDFCCIAICFVI